MAANYASGLSKYDNKGVCGTPEIVEDDEKLTTKIELLSRMLKESKYCVLYVGAGLSTSAGIPDFRGPKGVWTLEKEEEKARKKSKNKVELTETVSNSSSLSLDFEKCFPTFSHRAIRQLIKEGMIKFIVSQNVDGLFVKDGISRKYLAELHGNYFVDECSHCNERFIRNRPSSTMGCKPSGVKCPRKRPCRGMLRDTILDWEQSLPEKELIASEQASLKADLALCLGTTLQIEPAGSLPLKVKKSRKRKAKTAVQTPEIAPKSVKLEPEVKTEMEKMDVKKEKDVLIVEEKVENEPEKDGKLVIINLQKTRFDSRADLVIHHYIDRVFEGVCKRLNITVPEYEAGNDPTLSTANDLTPFNR